MSPDQYYFLFCRSLEYSLFGFRHTKDALITIPTKLLSSINQYEKNLILI